MNANKPTLGKKIFDFFNSNWAITLLSTMIGVYAGIYLNNYFEKQSLLRSKVKAFNEVVTEINDNHQLLESYHQLLDGKYKPARYIFSYLTDDAKLIIPNDSLEVFIEKADSLFVYESSVPVKGGLELNGDVNLYFTSDLIARDLSDIVWESYKQTNYVSYTNFRCLTDMETIYKLQKEANALNADFKRLLFHGNFYTNRERRDEFMHCWNQLVFTQRMLLLFYNQKEEAITHCRS